MIGAVFFMVLLIVLILISLLDKEAFPFSHYPMFSRLYRIDQVVIYRIAIENEKGEIKWWTSKFHKYPEKAGKKLNTLKDSQTYQDPSLLLYRNKILFEIKRLIALEHQNVKAIHIVERSIEPNFSVKDKTIEIVPF